MTGLGALTWPEVASRDRSLLVVPLGSTEQHGPHLPLATDTDVAVALCSALAERCPELVVVAPPLPYGASGEHADFPGTLSIGQDAVELLLVELCRSASATFERVLVVNGHGGNSVPLRRAVTLLVSEGRDVRTWSPRWPGDAHAGRTETSVQLALSASRVRLPLAAPGATAPIADLLPVLRERGVRAVSPGGVLGDPTGSTAEAGRALLAAATDDLVTLVRGWAG